MSKKTDADEDGDRVTNWLNPTVENKDWLNNEVRISSMPGHSRRQIIEETMAAGLKTGRLALARVEE
jgi:hypothetical protein